MFWKSTAQRKVYPIFQHVVCGALDAGPLLARALLPAHRIAEDVVQDGSNPRGRQKWAQWMWWADLSPAEEVSLQPLQLWCRQAFSCKGEGNRHKLFRDLQPSKGKDKVLGYQGITVPRESSQHSEVF